MATLLNDPINSAIYNGIKRGIVTTIEHQCLGSAVVLIYSGIDTMAFLSMPPTQDQVKPVDFVDWCNTYIKFKCKEQISGLEFYSARCAVLHTFGVESRLTRTGGCRELSYVKRNVPEVCFDPTIDANMALVSIEALANAFYEGLDRFLVDTFTDPTRATTAEARLQKLLVHFQIAPKSD